MISAEDFKRLWNEEWSPLISYSKETIQDVPISEVTREFLIRSGLPDSCAPFLSFNQKVYYEGLKSIKEEYELENNDFVSYYAIGSGDNVSVCIDTERDDQIFQIDIHHVYNVDSKEDTDYHEDYIPVMFMNTYIEHLAHCLLEYHNFVEDIRLVRNNQPAIEIQLTEIESNKLVAKLLNADQNCLRKKSYWWFELEGLKTP
ncbi:SUKH-4 family immunity protein [Tunicatimonas pelagia]|uniref:SUKH-4 family immunity protein n=1 Tax=Tunicatimonas pelagia TaxID=931531 RepID=UPI0026653B1F|nr:SUKH-4 family immunity protein [Tunicatimonas pelagia]WKN42301.1 SUKH-4 family immunity protein [Tunicatimonas pelagia]